MDPSRCRSRRLAPALAAAVLSLLTSASPSRAADPLAPRRAWPQVHIADPATAGAVRAALDGAADRLGGPRCAEVFSAPTLRDRAGRPLDERLVSLGTDGPDYLRRLRIYDGSSSHYCDAERTLAFTEPGAGFVFVCGRRFWRAWAANRPYAEAAVIHEALHTLGLGENPPSSEVITRTVLSYCVASPTLQARNAVLKERNR
jgi:hypothetical protein